MLMRLQILGLIRHYYYREIYRRKILSTKPVVCDSNSDFEIHILTSKKDFLNAVWCLKTFYYYSKTRPELVIHEDGTFGTGEIKTGFKHFPNCKIIRKSDADRDIQDFLTEFKYSRKYRLRKDFPTGVKLFDSFYYAQSERLLLLDSDVLFFRNPTEIIKNIQADKPFFNSDYFSAYCSPPEVLGEIFGIEIIPKINSGLMFLRKQHYVSNLDLVEYYFRKMEEIRGDVDIKWYEQTMHAILLSKYGAVRLSEHHQISRTRPISDKTVSHHFVADGSGSRIDFYREGLRHHKSRGFLKRFNIEMT
jgi:hypothetical protein